MNQRARARGDEGIRRRPETKSFILTSEFWVAAGAAAAVFIAGYALDDIAETTAWRYGTWVAIAYIVSRGIAKAGSQRAYQPEPTTNGQDFWGSGDGYRDDRYQNGARDDREERRVPAGSTRGDPAESSDAPRDGTYNSPPA